MGFNFGILFSIICLIGGVLIIVCCQPIGWRMKKKGMPNHYKWCFRVPGILLILFGLGIIVMSIISDVMF